MSLLLSLDSDRHPHSAVLRVADHIQTSTAVDLAAKSKTICGFALEAF